MSSTDSARLAWLDEAIRNSEHTSGFNVHPARYPYSYAFDYLRRHAPYFSMTDAKGSQEAVAHRLAERLQTDLTSDLFAEACRRLADAYIRSENLVWLETDDPDEALATSRALGPFPSQV